MHVLPGGIAKPTEHGLKPLEHRDNPTRWRQPRPQRVRDSLILSNEIASARKPEPKDQEER